MTWSNFQALAGLLAAFLTSGCIASGAIGGGFTKGSPPAPTGDGLSMRFGVGAGRGTRRGAVQAVLEYNIIGDFELVGGSVEGGLHVWTPSTVVDYPPAGSDKERRARIVGRTLGGGLTIKARLATARESVLDDEVRARTDEVRAWSAEAALGVAWAESYAKAGPENLGLYLYTTRISYGEDASWTIGLNLAVSVALSPLWHALVDK